MNRIFSRNWVSPVITVSFLVVSVTGVFLALHLKIGNIKIMHEWLGYLFLLAGTTHFVLNRKAFVGYYRDRGAIVATSACVFLAVLMTFSGGGEKSQAGKHPAIRLIDRNADGIIDSGEIQAAVAVLNRLDRERNGSVSAQELLAVLSPKGPRK